MVRGDARILQSKMQAGDFEGFHFRSIVKETGIDDEGLNEFGTEYFPYPTYKDQDLTFYNALGSGKVSFGFNPFAWFKRWGNLKALNVKSYNMKGEAYIQGGWIIFDTNGIPQAAFQENAKKRVPIDDILKEVQSMQSGNKEQQCTNDEEAK